MPAPLSSANDHGRCLLLSVCAGLLQPCLENKSLGRKQTLTYLKGYPQQDPDVSGLMSYDGKARPAQSPKIGTYSGSGSSSGAATGEAVATGSPKCDSTLPKWVEQDRQVCWAWRDCGAWEQVLYLSVRVAGHVALYSPAQLTRL